VANPKPELEPSKDIDVAEKAPMIMTIKLMINNPTGIK
jgi:hypothetical protein